MNTGTTQVRAVVVGDQPLIRDGLAYALAAQAGVGAESLADRSSFGSVARAMSANAVVACPNADQAALLESVTVWARTLPVVVVAGDGSPAFVRSAFAAGCVGVVPTAATVPDLVEALREVVAGRSYLHPVLGAALAQVEASRPVDDLSDREREVLRLIGLGLTNPEIARMLVVSTRTVETHRAHLARKLRAQTRADLVRHALSSGLVTAD